MVGFFDQSKFEYVLLFLVVLREMFDNDAMQLLHQRYLFLSVGVHDLHC